MTNLPWSEITRAASIVRASPIEGEASAAFDTRPPEQRPDSPWVAAGVWAVVFVIILGGIVI